MDAIEFVIKDLIGRVALSSGDDLLGFKIDADAQLEDCEFLMGGSVRRTGEPACMLELSAKLSPTAGTLHQARQAARQIWENLYYETFEATSWTAGPEVATLRFVTAVPDAGLCVTGRLLIGGEHYERLVRKGR